MSVHSRIQNNAHGIVRLHQELHAAIARRSDGPSSHALWQVACSNFHSRYDELAFPGGPRTARNRLRASDPVAIEYALAFLEVRPYFFRSGYMFKEFIRVLRKCPLSDSQRDRYNFVKAAYDVYRAQRKKRT